MGILFWLAMASVQQAEDAVSLMLQARQAYTAKDYAKCAELYGAAVNAGLVGSDSPYNAACCYALSGKSSEAFGWLTKAIQAGWRNVDHLKEDSDLASLRTDERWPKIVERCEKAAKKFADSIKEPALHDALLQRMKKDQGIRMAPHPDMAEWAKIDADNTAYMKTVIDKYGWPGNSMVGEDGALAAFLLVQHADLQSGFQKQCLPLLEAAVQAKEAAADHVALLTDRVLIAEGKPQRYGTQFRTVGGESVPFPIEDPENVDARRKAVGLEPLAEYARQMQSMQKNEKGE